MESTVFPYKHLYNMEVNGLMASVLKKTPLFNFYDLHPIYVSAIVHFHVDWWEENFIIFVLIVHLALLLFRPFVDSSSRLRTTEAQWRTGGDAPRLYLFLPERGSNLEGEISPMSTQRPHSTEVFASLFSGDRSCRCQGAFGDRPQKSRCESSGAPQSWP